MIYDCFTFFNELDVLEIRLNELNDVVDKFVLVESPITFTGKPKPLFYKENLSRFEKFNHKIIHIIDDEIIEGNDKHWEREAHQRNKIMAGLASCDPEDTILISDADEIPKAECVCGHKSNPSLLVFELHHTFCYLNLFFGLWHHGTRMLRRKDLQLPQTTRFENGPLVEHAGWHFGYLGDANNIITKLGAFSHVEQNIYPYNDLEHIEQRISEGRDTFGESLGGNLPEPGKLVEPHTLPRYIQNNLERFDRLIFKKELPVIKESEMSHRT